MLLLRTLKLSHRNCVKQTCNLLISRFRSTLNDLSGLKGFRPDSYYHQLGATPLVSTTIGRLLDLGQQRFVGEEAIVDVSQGIRKTYSDLKIEVDKLASGFLALNLHKGDRLGIWSPNRYEWILTQMAAAKAGLILVTINPAYQAPEVDYCLTKVGIKALVFPEKFLIQDYYKIISTLAPEISESKPGFIKPKNYPFLESLIVISDRSIPGTFRFSDVMNAGGSDQTKALKQLQSKIQPDDDATIMFTSGTTSKPKAVLHSHFSMINSCAAGGRKFGFYEQKHRICCNVPLFHIFGTLGGGLSQIVNGATCVLPSQEYNTVKILKAIETEQCTCLYGTPTMYIDLIRSPQFAKTDISSVRTVFGGGARFTPELIRQLYQTFPKVNLFLGYATTESCGISTASEFFRKWTTPEEMDHVGQIADNTEIKIVNKDDEIVPMGTEGEICSRGYFVMKRYWKDDEKTKESIKNGWLYSGDLGTMMADGYLKITGRIKEIIIRGGENINPKEIEDVLATHPSIIDAQVIGVKDERLGEDVCVWIKLVDNTTLTDEQVREFCRGKMAHYKIPRYIRFVTKFPITLSGKVQKFLMVEEMNKFLGSQNK